MTLLEIVCLAAAVPFIGEWAIDKGSHPYHMELDDTPPPPAQPIRGKCRAYDIDPLMRARPRREPS